MDLRPVSVRDAVPSLQAIAAHSVQSLANSFTQDNLETLASGIPLFWHLLDGTSSSNNSSSEQHLTNCAAASLCILSWQDGARSMLLGEGCVSQLLQTISNSSGSISAAKTPAAKAAAEVLACLALHEDSRAGIVQAGGIATLLGMVQVLVEHEKSTVSLLAGPTRTYRQIVSSSDSDLADDEGITPGREYDDAACEVLLHAATAFIELHAASDTKHTATEALLQHERGAGLLLDLCTCRYTWWGEDLGHRAQVVLFGLLQQHDEYPAAREGFRQAGGVGYLLKLLEDGLDWASDWDDSDDGADEEAMMAVEATTSLAATAAGRAALQTSEVFDDIVHCLLQMTYVW
jgi:hypothetical protein